LQVLKRFAGEGWRRSVETIRGKNKVLQTLKVKSNALHGTERRKANWIEHILHRNNLLKYVIATKIAGKRKWTGRRGRRHKRLLDDLREREDTGR
jgi:hypothetical protein